MKLAKKNLNYLRIDKNDALKAIDISIEEWNNFKKKNIISQLFLEKKKSIHWQVSNLFLGLFHIHLKWSNRIIRSQTNIDKEDVNNALIGIKEFYLKISTLKPDLSHPDIIQCYNLTAKKNKISLKKISLKENIEIDILDPFKNVFGKDMKNLQANLTEQKEIAINDIEYSLYFFNQSENKLEKKNVKHLKQPKNLIYNKINKKYDVKLIWFEKELKFEKNLNKHEVKLTLEKFKKIINSFNINRPNLDDPLINEMYKVALMNFEYKKEKSFFRYISTLQKVSKIFSRLKFLR